MILCHEDRGTWTRRDGGIALCHFHTHRHRYQVYAGRTDVIAVQSVMYGLELPLPEANYVTLGIHPMQDDVQELVRRLRVEPDKLRADLMAEINALGGRCCGIGECGWDRRSVLSWRIRML
ncbi:hypothetical protein [Porphyromonas cangingivalis]|uniref:hypothetical protein n=1 Tax=Porphyromonas cangingivalis TaxID=36874 RepID=UPI00046E5EDE|nr:hypothetical protein [Porphyromonas cangingivalis]